MPKCLSFQDLEGLTEVFGRMSAGISVQRLPLWAEFSFLTFVVCNKGPGFLGAKRTTQTFLYKVFQQPFGSWTSAPKIVDVRAENRGRPHQKVRFPAAPVVGRNFLTPGHSGVRVRNVRRKSGPKSLCLCCFFLPWILSSNFLNTPRGPGHPGKIAWKSFRGRGTNFSLPVPSLRADNGHRHSNEKQ